MKDISTLLGKEEKIKEEKKYKKKHVYLFTRARARRFSLLSKGDYSKMIDLSFSEMLVYLKSRSKGYEKEISEFGVLFKDKELLEVAIRNRLSREYGEFLGMARRLNLTKYMKMFETLEYRFLIHNAKLFFTGKIEGIDVEEIKTQIYDVYPLTFDVFILAYKNNNIDIILRHLHLDKDLYVKIKKSFERGKLADILMTLDTQYLRFLKSILTQPTQLLYTIHMITQISKKYLANISPDSIEELINNIGVKFIIAGKDASTLLRLSTYEEFIDTLLNAPSLKKIKKYLSPERLKNKYLFEQEMINAFYKYLFDIYKREMLTINSVISYLLLKENQARNLMIIVNAKKHNLSKEEIMERLIIPE